MKTILLTALASCYLFIIIGCKTGAPNTPEKVTEAFVTALHNKDLDAAANLCTKESQSIFGFMKMAMGMAKQEGKEGKANDKLDKFKDLKADYGVATITGDKASVPIIVDGKEKFKMPLVKEDGLWKIDFSLGTLMEISGENASEQRGVSPEDMKNMEEALKYANADSLKKVMEDAAKTIKEGEKMLDSMNKH